MSTAAVIGCDGIKSRTRKLLFGDNEPVSHASYTHQVAYRAVVPIAGGVAALGEDKANNQCMHMGPNAHVLTYPVSSERISFSKSHIIAINYCFIHRLQTGRFSMWLSSWLTQTLGPAQAIPQQTATAAMCSIFCGNGVQPCGN